MGEGKMFNLGGEVTQRLQLADPDFDPTRTGYNRRDTNFVLENLALAQKANFLDTCEIMERNDYTHAIDRYLNTLDKPRLVIGEVLVYPHEEGGLQVLEPFLQMIHTSQKEGLGPRQVIIPLNVSFAKGESENHAMILLLEEDAKAKGGYRIALLEQHAKHDGSRLDFSAAKERLAAYVQAFYPGTTVTQNKKAFCTLEHVCGIATLAMCKNLLCTEDTSSIITNPPHLNDVAIQEEHASNVALALTAQAHRDKKSAKNKTSHGGPP